MNRLYENHFYRLLMLLATLAGIMAYAWMGSKLMEPRLELPASIGSAHVIEGGASQGWPEAFQRHSFLLAQATRELDRFQASIEMIHGLRSPVDLVVSFDSPERYLVTDGRVEIGSSVLSARGQLAKALVKAWVYQRARADVRASVIRVEVVSDLLWAMLNGSLGIEALGEGGEELVLPRPQHWLLYAASLKSHCESPWKSLELGSLCSASPRESSNMMLGASFRPFLDSVVWATYQELPLFQRIGFLESWVRWIVSGDEAPEGERPEAIGQWKTWLRGELDRILPESLRPEKAFALALAATGLEDKKTFDIDFLFRSLSASPDEAKPLAEMIATGNQKLWKTKTVALVEVESGWMTLPGLALLPDAEKLGLRARNVVWESCQAPSLKDVLSDSVRSQRVLYVSSCDKPLSVSYSPLITLGVQGFALSNPGVSFALLKRPALELAASKKLIPSQTILADLVKRAPGLDGYSSQLGIKDARWNRDAQAYRVLGAVEAVEWYRSETESPKPIEAR